MFFPSPAHVTQIQQCHLFDPLSDKMGSDGGATQAKFLQTRDISHHAEDETLHQ